METILILGGTKEAAQLAAELVASKPHARIISSLAGRTKEPKPVAGEVRIGGFGGAKGLAAWLKAQEVDQVIDATHPFATQISSNAKLACELTGVPLETRARQPWAQQAGDQWQHVASIEDAVQALPTASRILLALGSQHIAPFSGRADVWFLVRMVDAPEQPLPLAQHRLLLQRPSPDWQAERNMMRENQITHIVCRNSGGPGAYAKIQAARDLAIPVIMIGRHPT